MSLNLPSPEDLGSYRESRSDADAIVQAGDLFTLATGIKETPTDPFEGRLVRWAILDMAWYLTENHENREAEFSPFTSERIGSYSYQKMQQAVQAQADTGVSAFDAAVKYFTQTKEGVAETVIVSSSEWVFRPPFDPHPERHKQHPDWHDPSGW